MNCRNPFILFTINTNICIINIINMVWLGEKKIIKNKYYLSQREQKKENKNARLIRNGKQQQQQQQPGYIRWLKLYDMV